MKDEFIEEDFSDTKLDKILSCTIYILGVAILYVLIVFLSMAFVNNSSNATSELVYNNLSLEQQVDVSNDFTLQYLESACKNNDSAMVSPISVQSALYNYYNDSNEENMKLLTSLGNSSDTWGTSGSLFKADCFHYIRPNAISSSIFFSNKVTYETDGEITDVSDNFDIDVSNLFSITSVDLCIDNAESMKLLNYIACIDVNTLDSSNINAYGLSANDGKYTLYVSDSALSLSDFEHFTKNTDLVYLSNILRQSFGVATNLVQTLGCDDISVSTLNQLKISTDDSNSSVADFNSEDAIFLEESGFYFYVVYNETGLIVLAGK